jgi:NAD(P)-dependent dehydrogenase (short-subunit alcohol dehydrogenase family)
MPSVTDARAFNSSYKPSTAGSSSTSSTPVAVVVGGTAGIGAGIAGALASSFKGDVDVYIIGRNKAAGQAVLDGLPLPSPSQDGAGARRPIRDFIPCDAWLMRDVASTTAELKTTKGVDKINYLVMSPGIMTLQGRTESDEGIDQKLALHYYARWKFAYE